MSSSQYIFPKRHNRDLADEFDSNGQHTSPRKGREQHNSADRDMPSSKKSMWKFRITESDFFVKYMEEQAKIQEEIERQKAEMYIVKPQPYKPVVKVTS